MATKWYLSNSTAAVSPTPASGWSLTSAAVTRELTDTPTGASTSVPRAGTAPSASSYYVLLGRFVSPPVLNTGTVAGGFSVTFARQISDIANILGFINFFVVSEDGSTSRGTLINGTTGAWTTGAAASTASGTITTPVVVQPGDRIVVDLGYRQQIAATRTGTLYYGGTSGTDLASGDTGSTATSRSGWVQFDGIDGLFTPMQRLYLTNTPAAVSPEFSPSSPVDTPITSGGWEDTAAADRFALSSTKAGPIDTVTRAETTTDDTWDVLLGQWTSPPLATSGSVPNVFAWLYAGSAIGSNLITRALVKVVSGDGNTARGYLINSASAAAFTTTPTGRGVTASTVSTSVSYQAGDRVVVELGYRTTNTTSTSASVTMWYGGTDATDLTNNDENTDHPGSVDVPASLVFGTDAAEIEGTAQATLGALSAHADGTVTAEVVPGAASATLGGLTAQALGTVTAEVVPGQAQATLGQLTATALGEVTAEVITATATAQLGALTASAAGTRSTTGPASAVLGSLAAQALGTVTAEVVPGQAQAQLGALTSTAAADIAVTATAQALLGGLLAQANATGASTGTAQAVLGALVATADETVTAEVVTGAATALFGALLAAANASGSSSGTAQALLGALTAHALGEVTAEVVSGTAPAQLGSLSATAIGSGLVPTITGTAQAQLGGLTAQALADVLVPALAAAQLGGLLASTSGRRTRHGLAQAVLGPLVAAAVVTPPVAYAEMRPALVPAPALSGVARSAPTMRSA